MARKLTSVSNLSDVFKYISHFRHAGHQVGRKVGDMLEVITYAAIAQHPELLARLQVEPKVMGFSSAEHKVEFTFLKEPEYDIYDEPMVRNGGRLEDLNEIFAFIECKKVGVEQTINTSFKRKLPKSVNKTYRLEFNQSLNVSFAPRGGTRHEYFVTVDPDKNLVVKKNGVVCLDESIDDGHRVIFCLAADSSSEVIGNDNSLRDYPKTLSKCRILEINTVTDEGLDVLLNDCLSGPQTPEKAKQSSFVALDIRKLRFGSFDKRDNETELLSVLVMTEFAHWEPKSQKMIRACIDTNLVVSDEIIVEAFKRFEDHFGSEFYERITKEQFENNLDVRSISIDLVGEQGGKVFTDIEDGKLKKLVFEPNRLIFTS